MGDKLRIAGRTGGKMGYPTECESCDKTIRGIDWSMWSEPGHEYGETEPWCMACTLSWKTAIDETDWSAVAKHCLEDATGDQP